MTIVPHPYPSIRDISRSWLYFWQDNLTALSIPLQYQVSSMKPDALQPDILVIAALAQEWRVSPTVPDTLEVNFRLRVVTRQKPGEVLTAYERNLATQLAIDECLFSTGRYVSGYSTGSMSNYAIPFRRFDSQGNPVELLERDGLRYARTSPWVSREPEEATRCAWTLDVAISVSG